LNPPEEAYNTTIFLPRYLLRAGRISGYFFIFVYPTNITTDDKQKFIKYYYRMAKRSAEAVITDDNLFDSDQSDEEPVENVSDSGRPMTGQPPFSFLPSKRVRKRASECDDDYAPTSGNESDSESEQRNNEQPNNGSANLLADAPNLNKDVPDVPNLTSDTTPSGKGRTRWRLVNELTKQKIVKRLRSSGQGFKNDAGKDVPPKSIRPIENHSHGKSTLFKCSEFDEASRIEMFNAYWQKGEDYKGKKEFLLQYTSQSNLKRCRTKMPSENTRN
uniref:Uncharacterized protein n=1 Tax=Romanomermis culicivorax TaxID=13658 RepID=A0A915KXF1_ROMCU